MEEEKRNGCTECMRYGFVILNATFLLMGVVLITFGTWFYAIPASQNIVTIVFDERQQRQLNNALLLVICIGGGVCFAACVSWCGAFAQSRCLLVTVFAMVGVLVIAEMAFIGLGVVSLGVLSSGSSARMSETLATGYAGDHSTNAESVGWKEMQKYFSCCGVNTPEGYQNHTNVQFGNFTGSLWYRDYNDTGMPWPVSCCGAIKSGAPAGGTKCKTVEETFVSKKGCQAEVEAFLNKHLLYLIGIAAATLICQVIAAVLICQLYMDVGRTHNTVLAIDLPATSKGYDRLGNACPAP